MSENSAKVTQTPLAMLLELHGPVPPLLRVAAFLRHDAKMQRESPSGRWDIPETMARAYDSAASILETHHEASCVSSVVWVKEPDRKIPWNELFGEYARRHPTLNQPEIPE